MARVFYESDRELLAGRRVAIIGYGSQGHAHAQNIRDSGYSVRVGLRAESASRPLAEREGFDVGSIAEAAEWGDLIAVLLPDQYHRSVYEKSIEPHVAPGKLLLFAHGFSIQYGQVQPPPHVDVALVAPVSPGHSLRRLYLEGQGVPAVLAVQQDVTGTAHDLALAYAGALGCTRSGVILSTFEEETETDLFGEQAVLCGGIPALMQAGFETLVAAGYQPEVAYFECVHQVKMIVDLIYEGGFSYLASRISDTAEFGADRTAPRVTEAVREPLRGTLRDIQNGTFAREWIDDYEAGMPMLRAMREERRAPTLEEVGERLRLGMRLSTDK